MKAQAMVGRYELFERFPDNSTLWRACVTGIQSAQHTLMALSAETRNECYAMNLRSGKIIARFNGGRPLGRIPASSSPRL